MKPRWKEIRSTLESDLNTSIFEHINYEVFTKTDNIANAVYWRRLRQIIHPLREKINEIT